MVYLVTLGQTLGLIAGVVIATGVLWKSPVGKGTRWVYRRICGEPVTAAVHAKADAWLRSEPTAVFIREQVAQVVDEKLLTRNGGTTVPDVVRSVADLRGEVRTLAGRFDDFVKVQGRMHEQNIERIEKIETGAQRAVRDHDARTD